MANAREDNPNGSGTHNPNMTIGVSKPQDALAPSNVHPYNTSVDPSVNNWNGTPGMYYAKHNQPPAVPVNVGGHGKELRVNTDALKLFTSNLRQLQPMLKKCMTDLNSIALLPGHFEDAFNLADMVVNSDSIRAVTVKFLTDAIDCIVEYAAGLDTLASEYTKTEELNKLSGAKLADLVKDAQSYLTATGVTPTSITSPTG